MAARDLPAADQPSIVLAAQKDAHYRKEMRESFLQAADAVLGPHMSVAALPEIKLLAELAYFGLTTLRGRQTPGEEYCDVFLVKKSQGGGMALPPFSSRLILLITAVLLPYVGKRIEGGGWKSLLSLFQKPLSARERAEAFRKQMLLRQQRPAQQQEGGGGMSIAVDGEERSETSYLSLLWEKRAWFSWLLGWSSYIYRVHLAVFYLRGEYMDWSKRAAGLQYSLTRAPPAERASYRVLGWLLIVQLLVESYGPIRGALHSVGKAWGIVYKPATSSSADAAGEVQGDSGEDLGLAGSSVAVPCLASGDLDDEEAGYGTFIRGEDRHAKGLEHANCGICLSPVENGAAPPCGHLFCYQHILEAVAVRKECPLCRHECEPSDVCCVYYSL